MGKKYTGMLIFGILIIVIGIIFFRGSALLFPILVLGITIAWLRNIIEFFVVSQKERNLDQRFPSFVRNLTGAIKSGMPVSKAIIHVSDSDYGALTPHIKKLANKVGWSISLHKALESLADDTKSSVIQRAVATVIEAERAGGNIEDVLGKVTESLITISKLKEERKAAIHGQIVQSYIIFIVFLGIMIMIQNMLIPFMIHMEDDAMMDDFEGGDFDMGAGMGMFDFGGGGSLGALVDKVSLDWSSPEMFVLTALAWMKSVYGIFMMLAIIQGIFAGLVIGKLSEGMMIAGLKHSMALTLIAMFTMSISQYFV